MIHNTCKTCGANNGRAGLLINNECLNCHDTRTSGDFCNHFTLERTEDELLKTMNILNEKNYLTLNQRYFICLLLSMIIVTGIIVFGTLGGYIGEPNGTHENEFRVFYYITIFLNFIFLLKAKQFDISMPTLLVLFLSPVMLLSLLIMWISYKIYPIKHTTNGEN